MINYTTPTITLTVEGVDLTPHDVYVSLEQGTHELHKTGNDLTITTDTHGQVTDTIITLVLTQEESASFNVGKAVNVQVNYVTADGVRDATEIKTVNVMRNLLDEVVNYGNQTKGTDKFKPTPEDKRGNRRVVHRVAGHTYLPERVHRRNRGHTVRRYADARDRGPYDDRKYHYQPYSVQLRPRNVGRCYPYCFIGGY